MDPRLVCRALPRISGLAICCLVGCSSYEVVMAPIVPPVDDSVVSPDLVKGKYQKIMVVPPSGATDGTVDLVVMTLEKEFLKSGLTAVSCDITGRVVRETPDDAQGKRIEAASQLSDAERALVLSAETGADALFQIGEFTWSEKQATRFFLFDEDLKSREVAFDEFRKARPPKYSAPAPMFNMAAKLVDVRDGRVLATFQVRAAANYSLPEQLVRHLDDDGDRWRVIDENFDYDGDWWVEDAKRRIEAAAIQIVVRRISAR